tara:strand:- start:277 stop:1125 length:849 start_codon:yes stop_codon:yes gene_type:complete
MLNKELLKSLCQISGLVYKPSSFFNENYCKKQFPTNCSSFKYLNKQPLFIESNIDCQCYVSIFNKDSILCAFRGTENTRDWLTDANMIRVRMDLKDIEGDNRPRAHWGILRQFRSVEKNITDYIEEEIKNKDIKNIVYTGHSLGGALATIAAQNFGHKYPTLNHMCVTFGAPRCGDDDFRKKFNKVCCFSKRFVNEYDPVPSLPFSLRYSHVCPSQQIKTNQLIDMETPISRFFWIMWYKFTNIFWSNYNPVDDHGITNYYDKLCSIYGDEETVVEDVTDPE